jgi:twitching motility protein PilT
MNLDYFVRNLARLQASAIVVTSGAPVVLRFPAGDKYSQQSLSHADLTKLLLESAPAREHANLRAGRAIATFSYASADAAFSVAVEAHSGAWKVTIRPAVQDEVSAAPAIPAPPREPSPPPTSVEAPPADDEGELHRILRRLVEDKASDVHLTAGLLPMYRVSGAMQPIPGFGALPDEQLTAMLQPIMPERTRKEFAETSDADFAYAIVGLSRFRINIARDRHGTFAVIRRIPYEILTPDQIGLPKKVLDLCWLTKGLVLVTGPTGSGKSTTLATLIDFINSNRQDHIVTIEDPVEFVHPDNKKCLIRQREVGEHTRSFKRALRAALREDPNIVLVGELRDLETIEIAIETAETGHLVFGTLHTSTAPSTIDRIVDQFPPDRQEQIRVMLAESLRGVIAQTLCKKIGGGRVAAYEIMLGNRAIANLIREGKVFQIFSIMQTSRSAGMLTLNDSLFQLVKNKVVSAEEAYMKAVQKDELKMILGKAGIELTLPGAVEEG